uniref:Calcium-responsive transactivator-like n=1 Tax=Phallusia mammillata TaxID=59560 RepID=A0A6F9DT45_9ASCI|nr:calcium-responsive transactivator-like [Phallusia mammillata]
MSVAFVPQNVRNPKMPVNPETIQKLLDENSHLIQCISENQAKGKVQECAQYQQILHRNLVWLATVADSNQSGSQQSILSGGQPGSKDQMMPPLSSSAEMNPVALNATAGQQPVTSTQPNSYPQSYASSIPPVNMPGNQPQYTSHVQPSQQVKTSAVPTSGNDALPQQSSTAVQQSMEVPTPQYSLHQQPAMPTNNTYTTQTAPAYPKYPQQVPQQPVSSQPIPYGQMPQQAPPPQMSYQQQQPQQQPSYSQPPYNVYPSQHQ